MLFMAYFVAIASAFPIESIDNNSDDNSNLCLSMKPLKEYDNYQKAEELLIKLCTDPKVLEFSKKYNWRKLMFVGELHPIKEGDIKGINRNNGDNIKIRLRDKFETDEFRPMDDILETWLHELTHNNVRGHLSNFDSFRKVLEIAYYGPEASSTQFMGGKKQSSI
jgi:hypothetical protein